jgi:hypothetical protein
MSQSLIETIRAAWPATPYPGDHVLSDCWCEECEFSVRSLRGKSWKQLRPNDINGETSHMSNGAFAYYLPGLLLLSIKHDMDGLDGYVLGHFSSLETQSKTFDHAQQSEHLLRMASRFSDAQRTALSRYFDWIDQQGFQCPAFVRSAPALVLDGKIDAVPHQEVMTWINHQSRLN